MWVSYKGNMIVEKHNVNVVKDQCGRNLRKSMLTVAERHAFTPSKFAL
jgi:hypothetical protein